MAEVATGVLHNVGNALNGVNLSATMLSDLTRRSRLGLLRSVSVLIDEHADNLPVFLTSDKRGQQLPTFLRHLADALEQERATLRSEVEAIVENVDHLKAIVRAQQSYSACCGVTECVMICSVVDDALKLVGPSLARHGIEVIRRYADTPLMTLDKQKLLQILVNLIKNAKEAILELPGCSATITLSTEVIADRGVFIQVSDSGIGIAQEGLAEIFRHGYTTKKTRGGNGFGLHHSALAARELGGSLTARSEGINQGAVFTLELPFSAVEQFEE
jgi:signal transduction histidine kinase